jgi:hypothetical protein
MADKNLKISFTILSYHILAILSLGRYIRF